MPSNTYHNLSEEKKKKLIEAAILEFTKVPYPEASINHIIHQAGISRGSFYTYFKNKDELFEYILYSHKEKFDEFIKTSLIEKNGDIREAFLNLFDHIIKYIEKENREFFKQVFLNLNYQTKRYIMPEKKDCKKGQTKEFEKYIDQRKLTLTENLTLDDVFEILISITIPAIIEFILKNKDVSMIREKYEKKLNVLCFGIYRKDETL